MPRKVHRSPRRLICLSALMSVFLVSIPMLAHSAGESKATATATALQSSSPAFTLTTSRTFTRSDGVDRLLSTQQRFQRADGLYKLVQTIYTPSGTVARTQTYFGFIGLGVFRLDEAGGRLIFTGPHIDDRPADLEQFL